MFAYLQKGPGSNMSLLNGGQKIQGSKVVRCIPEYVGKGVEDKGVEKRQTEDCAGQLRAVLRN